MIIFQRPCVLLDKSKKPTFVVNDKCTGCGVCSKLGCPAISVDAETGNAVIDQTQCIACNQCSQYCRFDAIGPKE